MMTENLVMEEREEQPRDIKHTNTISVLMSLCLQSLDFLNGLRAIVILGEMLPIGAEIYPSKSEYQVAINPSYSINISLLLHVSIVSDQVVQQKKLDFEDCNLLLMICLGIVMIFCVITTICVICVLIRRKKKEEHVPSPLFPPSTESHRKVYQSRTKEPLRLRTSSTGSTTSSDLSSVAAPEFKHFPVPPSVRKRKSQVNAELLDLFGSDGMPYPPHLMNYYGYMVVPHPASVNKQKKSVRSVKRSDRERNAVPEVFQGQDPCSCSSHNNAKTVDSDHKAVIKITSSGNDIPSNRRHGPRSLKDPIYCEIQQDTQPTMV